MTRKVALVAVAIVAIAVLVWTCCVEQVAKVSNRVPPAAAGIADKPVAARERAPMPSSVSRERGEAAAPSSLPPLDSSVAVILGDLEARAHAGDVRAACRVAMEKVRCHRVLTMPTNAAKSTPEIEARIEKDRGLCNGVEVGRTGDAWKYLSQAALAGNIAAMSLFVRDPQLSERSPIETAEGWLVYRDYAARFLTSAIEGGDTMALWYAWFTSATGLSTVGRPQEVFPKDPYRALVYGNAVAPLLDARRQAMVTRMNGMLAESMTSAQVGQAKRDAEDLRSRYFANASRASDNNDDTYLAPQDCAR